MFRRIFAVLFLTVFVISLFSCAEDTPSEDTSGQILFDADLTPEALCEILREKGDAVRFSDIPAHYFYEITSPVVPQLRYPMDEHTAFYIIQTGEDTFSVLLVVGTEGNTLTYSGAQEILDYFDSIN